jgi:HAD superfamily hydrolase (TIGR01484 family)
MRYLAFACDYDGTIATEGVVFEHVLEALKRLRDSGRQLCLVTGRELEDLRRVFPELDLFDRVVVENGAQVFTPATREERLIAEAPPARFAELLRERGVSPLSVGRVIVATWEPHEKIVLETIRDLGLELQVIFNKGAVMVLPTGVNKAAGLRAALKELHLSPHNTVAVGDAENDHALLAECEVGVAVANALPMLKTRADWVTAGARGDGVVELIEQMLASDLSALEPRLTRAEIELGQDERGAKVTVHAYGRRLLVCGTSGSGKSTLTTGFLERLTEKRYQFCLFDPEGDYTAFEDTIVVGDEQTAPKNDEIVDLLIGGDKNVVVNLLGVPLEQRSAFFAALLARLMECRTRWGRPHWIVVDEAHHMLPEGHVILADALEHLPAGLLLVTVHPERLAARILAAIDTLIVVGEAPEDAFQAFARAAGTLAPHVGDARLPPGEALVWSPARARNVVRMRTTPPKAERHRHRRKYAQGALGEDKSFYFRGPSGALNLRAHNLALFLQIADGVDDETWMHHLRQHDYSHWLRDAIKNPQLADEVYALEGQPELGPRASRGKIREAIEKIYTLPA